jgi:hypothetical protein
MAIRALVTAPRRTMIQITLQWVSQPWARSVLLILMGYWLRPFRINSFRNSQLHPWRSIEPFRFLAESGLILERI